MFIYYFFYFFAAVNITRPRFSGLDEFGYSSYVAYPSIPSMGHFYEFHLKLTFANNVSALRNSLILFSGQKGQGESKWEYCLYLLLHLSLFTLISVHPSVLSVGCCIYWCMKNKSWSHSSLAVKFFPHTAEVMLKEVRFGNSITQLGDINGAAPVKCAVNVNPGPNSRDNLSVHKTGR